MDIEEIVQLYIDLLIIQYRGKEKARATIDALVRPMLMEGLPIEVQNAFNVEDAIGNQLEIIGKYAGVTRFGVGPFGPITLNDADFRSLIILAIARNYSESTLKNIQQILFDFFPGTLYVYNFKNMRMGYMVSSAIGSLNLVYTFISQGLLPAPMGVQLSATILYPELTNFFGYRDYRGPNVNAKPYNTYADYNEDWPWLSYSYAIETPSSIDQSLITETTLEVIVQEDGDEMYV
tara:strand:- start:17664 stop:18368 length:705 start_codon:yes stop_codon:yes gene_type:complete